MGFFYVVSFSFSFCETSVEFFCMHKVGEWEIKQDSRDLGILCGFICVFLFAFSFFLFSFLRPLCVGYDGFS